MPLESTVLHILASSLGGPSISSDPLEILAEALDPPDPSTVHSALQELVEVGAVHFNDDEKRSELTPLGWHLSKLPVDARLGKIMIYGAIFGVSCFPTHGMRHLLHNLTEACSHTMHVVDPRCSVHSRSFCRLQIAVCVPDRKSGRSTACTSCSRWYGVRFAGHTICFSAMVERA